VVAGPEDLSAVHAQHKQNTAAAHVAKLASNAEKMARLQSIGSVPPLGQVALSNTALFVRRKLL
jgi:hypothetical protein